ncbi:MAG: ATP-binding protein [Pseudomonadota bacterium]
MLRKIVQLADSFSNMTHCLRPFEAKVRMSEERYRVLFDSTPNSIFVLDPESFRILDVNARTQEIYGWEKAELMKKTFMDLGPYLYAEGVLSIKDREPSVMSSVYQKVQHYRKDGTPFYVNVYARRTKRSRKYGIVAVPVDITESLEKESQLIQASKLSTLGEMASGVAHEINQPLAAIQIGADFIHNALSQPKEIPRADLILVSEQIREQIDRAVRIINHLREFGRKAETKKVKVYINTPIEGAFTLLGQQLKVRDIKVALELNDNLPPIMANSNRLEQVFIDLLINARDSMEEKREKAGAKAVDSILTVRSLKENGLVVVTISDTGIGLPDELRDKIFEPFFTTKGVGKGTGLGLSISYSIIKDYDGTMGVESEPGKGATFRIAFPACKEGQDVKRYKDKDISDR